MRKLRVFESISIDGYFVDAHGDMSWAHANDDREFGEFVSANASSGSELLLGRKTYEMMAAFWPTPMAAQQMPAVAAGMNAARKYVASRTLGEPAWANTQLLRGDAVAAVRALKATAGLGVVVLGSGSLVTQLGDAGLVDEYQLVINPIALGGGRTVFSGRRNLRLAGERTFKNGNVVVTYAV